MKHSSKIVTIVTGIIYTIFVSLGCRVEPIIVPVNADIPLLSTSDIKEIEQTSSVGGGTISSDGGSPVISRGVCWSTSPNPTISLSTKTIDGNGLGNFKSSLTGLLQGTSYQVRAYATNAIGTSYGDDVSFTTISNLISLSTADITSITSTSAISGGNIIGDGGSPVSERGVCWSTAPNPTIALSTKTKNGSGKGIFSSNISGLVSATVYHVRAYATNAAGTTYGNDLTFTTMAISALVPTVSTTNISSITINTANSGGNISSDGGSSVTARGICWSTAINPTIALSTKTTSGSGVGAFTSPLSGLSLGTKYYVRAFATNAAGTAYGNEVSFTLGVGVSFQGGVIAYLFQPGDPGYIAGQIHGIIAAARDQDFAIAGKWTNGAISVTGASGTLLGTGGSNTSTIVNKLGAGNYAAQSCADLVNGGYSDWYLPSLEELRKLYINRNEIGGFAIGSLVYYWSSSEYNNVWAWNINFNGGGQFTNDKSTMFNVRAVRAF